ncbi:MAG TPA: amidase family protein, partial [Bryobacteraceae bacterium]|nr:amidase family protein [Bryobacteraceae bacterium]
MIQPVTRDAAKAVERARATNQELNAFSLIRPDGAMTTAREGVLAGVPYAVKDLFMVEGEPNTAGSPIYRDLVATETATTVRRLDAAGAIRIGRTTLHE